MSNKELVSKQKEEEKKRAISRRKYLLKTLLIWHFGNFRHNLFFSWINLLLDPAFFAFSFDLWTIASIRPNFRTFQYSSQAKILIHHGDRITRRIEMTRSKQFIINHTLWFFSTPLLPLCTISTRWKRTTSRNQEPCTFLQTDLVISTDTDKMNFLTAC